MQKNYAFLVYVEQEKCPETNNSDQEFENSAQKSRYECGCENIKKRKVKLHDGGCCMEFLAPKFINLDLHGIGKLSLPALHRDIRGYM